MKYDFKTFDGMMVWLEKEFNTRCDYTATIEGYDGECELRLMDCAYQAENHLTFHIPSEAMRCSVGVNDWVKISATWWEHGGERFWVEITHVIDDADGNPLFYGVARNNLYGAEWGSKVGPFQSRHICDIEFNTDEQKAA
ncbi:hypothetical protein ACO0KY_18660 [Undibacterium sp. Dicai25W]|uniref:hypothetical protein n=1 Tax=Undibacterium sp. Dicai25W TaxID=3413034 RepID=UPI003BF10119